MTFEEFFKKKRIDVVAFEKSNPALLFEFKNHFEQMGEKSFDHTKKYWFNKLRLQYHLAPEVKTEKVHIENQLAEQTVAEALSEADVVAPKPGFTPRFKAPAPKPVEGEGTKSEEPETKPAAGFTPRFKPGVTKPAEPASAEETPSAPEKPKVGFTPRFKAGVTKPVETEEETKAADATPPVVAENADQPVASEKPKGFTPRFKAGVIKGAKPETEPLSEEKPADEQSSTESKPKGFTPRFKAGVTKAAESKAESSPEEKPTEEQAPVENKPKIGFTPRFKASAPTKQQDPPTEE